MLKMTGLCCTLLLLLPSFADAATYWQISASTSPAALKSNLLPDRPANFGNYTTPNGGWVTKVIRTPYPSVNFVATVPIGYKLVNVKVDGAMQGNTAGTYTVQKGTTLSHTIVASYAVASYAITTYAATGGNISSSLTAPAGTDQSVTVTSFNGYKLTGVLIDSRTYALADALPPFVTKNGDASEATYTFLAVNAAHSIKGIFAQLPTATAVISTPGQTVATGTTGIAIDGSTSSSNVAGTTYDWSATCGTVTPTGPNAKTATYAAPATIGSCTVTLTVISAGVTPSPQANVTVTTVSPVLVATNICLSCHDGTNGPAVPGFTSSPHYGIKSCVNCHNPDNNLSHAYSPLAAMVNICQNCHSDAQGNVPYHPLPIGVKTCVSCHNPHSTVSSGCDGCHESPPATASHLKHFGAAITRPRYGDTRITQAFSSYSGAYIFGCGNCHPVDAVNHANGVVDVELYSPLAPTGSLKAMNPASAVYVAGPEIFTDSKGVPYTKGTCSSIYCHSYNEWTTTEAIPDSDPEWQAKTVVTRNYKSMTWGGNPLTCSGCHGNPTQTSSTTNDGGAGDSHSWIDEYGYQNLHTYNMGSTPVSCMYCHNTTVNQLNTYTVDDMGVRTLSEVPISNFSRHVNGSNDVSFATQKPFVYSTWSNGDVSMSLANATYEPVTKNCSNVSCHREQTTVKWGTPYRWWNNECNVCHSY